MHYNSLSEYACSFEIRKVHIEKIKVATPTFDITSARKGVPVSTRVKKKGQCYEYAEISKNKD